ncbi:MAG: histone deacetylase, partial [Bacteroidia bacterium]
YADRVLKNQLSTKEERLIGFPQSYEMYLRSLAAISATISASEQSWNYGISATISGGTHHAYRDRGEGFCVFNDVAVAIQFLKKSNPNLRAFIIDLDVHQGNGTAAVFQNDPKVFTFSIHGEKNYPFRKEISDFDISLPPETNDDVYLFELSLYLLPLIEKYKPDILFYNAGVDILKEDKLGSLHISSKGCYERDLTVLSISRRLEI